MKERVNQKVLADTYVYQSDLNHDWFDTTMMQRWSKLRPGDRVYKNQFRFTRIEMNVRSHINPVFLVENGQLYYSNAKSAYRIDVIPRPTDYQLLQFIYGGQQRRIGLVTHLQKGGITIIRNLFIHPDETQQEYNALDVLNRYNYPVPTHPHMHQLFYPWNDTISYDFVPGISLHEAVENEVQTGTITAARKILFEFGQHLRRIWLPLLEGRLPNGLTYRFPDSVLGNWIYSPQPPNERRRFVRIDILGLSNKNPIGFENYVQRIREDILHYESLKDHCNDLITALRNGAFN